MRKLVLITIVTTLLIAGCIPSLHPLYTDDVIVEPSEIEGIWYSEEDDVYIKFDKAKDSKYNYSESDSLNNFVKSHDVVFVELNKELYVDFYPEKNETTWDIDMDYIPAHIFAHFDITDDHLIFSYADPDRLHQLFSEGKVRLKHELIKDGNIVITASSKEIQKFIKKYAKEAELFSVVGEFTRVSSQ